MIVNNKGADADYSSLACYVEKPKNMTINEIKDGMEKVQNEIIEDIENKESVEIPPEIEQTEDRKNTTDCPCNHLPVNKEKVLDWSAVTSTQLKNIIKTMFLTEQIKQRCARLGFVNDRTLEDLLKKDECDEICKKCGASFKKKEKIVEVARKLVVLERELAKEENKRKVREEKEKSEKAERERLQREKEECKRLEDEKREKSDSQRLEILYREREEREKYEKLQREKEQREKLEKEILNSEQNGDLPNEDVNNSEVQTIEVIEHKSEEIQIKMPDIPVNEDSTQLWHSRNSDTERSNVAISLPDDEVLESKGKVLDQKSPDKELSQDEPANKDSIKQISIAANKDSIEQNEEVESSGSHRINSSNLSKSDECSEDLVSLGKVKCPVGVVLASKSEEFTEDKQFVSIQDDKISSDVSSLLTEEKESTQLVLASQSENPTDDKQENDSVLSLKDKIPENVPALLTEEKESTQLVLVSKAEELIEDEEKNESVSIQDDKILENMPALSNEEKKCTQIVLISKVAEPKKDFQDFKSVSSLNQSNKCAELVSPEKDSKSAVDCDKNTEMSKIEADESEKPLIEKVETGSIEEINLNKSEDCEIAQEPELSDVLGSNAIELEETVDLPHLSAIQNHKKKFNRLTDTEKFDLQSKSTKQLKEILQKNKKKKFFAPLKKSIGNAVKSFKGVFGKKKEKMMKIYCPKTNNLSPETKQIIRKVYISHVLCKLLETIRVDHSNDKDIFSARIDSIEIEDLQAKIELKYSLLIEDTEHRASDKFSQNGCNPEQFEENVLSLLSRVDINELLVDNHDCKHITGSQIFKLVKNLIKSEFGTLFDRQIVKEIRKFAMKHSSTMNTRFTSDKKELLKKYDFLGDLFVDSLEKNSRNVIYELFKTLSHLSVTNTHMKMNIDELFLECLDLFFRFETKPKINKLGDYLCCKNPNRLSNKLREEIRFVDDLVNYLYINIDNIH